MFGIQPPTQKTIWYGARAIYERNHDDRTARRQPYLIDIVWDRQQMLGGRTDRERNAFASFISKKVMPALKRALKENAISPRDDKEVQVEVGDYVAVANPRASHGYLYIGVWPKADAPPDTPSTYPPDWPKCPGCSEPAMDGHITCGKVECNEAGRRAEATRPG